MSKESILSKSTKGVTFLMFTQFFTKILSFLLNSMLIRYLSPKIFGITAFLGFLQSTGLFFSREAIRLSTLRIQKSYNQQQQQQQQQESVEEKTDLLRSETPEDVQILSEKLSTSENDDDEYDQNVLQSIINFSYIPILLGLPLSLVLFVWQYTKLNGYFTELPFFGFSIIVLWLSIIIELLSEPFFNIHQYLLNYKIRSQFEGSAVTVSCFVNFLIVYLHETRYNGQDGLELHNQFKEEGIAIFAFACGKFFHSLTLLLLYYRDYIRNFAPMKKTHLKITKIRSSHKKQSLYFQNEILQHFKKVYFQMCFKHLLTEGDKFIINALCTVEEQGIYSLLSNYGSLVTRLLFAPIEEALRLFLTRLLSKKTNANLKLSVDVLINLTKFYLYLTIMIIIFGPINSSYLLRYLIGSKWSSTSVLETIRTYCFYLPFLSLNGIFEAFFQSVANGDQILKHSYVMMCLSGVFLLNCYVLIAKMKLSLEGLIYSNIINMVLRILYCVVFINDFYKKLFHGKSSIIVNFHNLRVAFFLSLVVWALDWFYLGGYTKNLKELAINFLLALFLLSVMIYSERRVIYGFIRSKTNKIK
ncbi:hypothetical protein ACO0QE_002882 [Hanseniaspora vineae]